MAPGAPSFLEAYRKVEGVWSAFVPLRAEPRRDTPRMARGTADQGAPMPLGRVPVALRAPRRALDGRQPADPASRRWRTGREANDVSSEARISADGRYVAFTSQATNLVSGDTNGTYDVFVRDRSAKTTRRVSVGAAGRQGDGLSFVDAISADGRHIAFTTSSASLVAGDTNGSFDVYVRSRFGDAALLPSARRRPD